MTSKEYLEFLQVATGLAEGHAVQTLEEPTLDTYKAILDREHRSNEYMLSTPEEELAAIETRIQNVRPYCSKYESLNDMLIMSDLKSGIDGALERLELAPFEDITIGTLPSGEMNALTIQVPGGQGHLIAFNRGVFTFIELAANILTQSIAIKKTNPEFATLESASRNVKFRLEYGWRDFAKTLLSAPN